MTFLSATDGITVYPIFFRKVSTTVSLPVSQNTQKAAVSSIGAKLRLSFLFLKKWSPSIVYTYRSSKPAIAGHHTLM
jgi:hypothetical protein